MYDPSKIEPKWQEYWKKKQTFHAKTDPEKKKYYILDMFPYPSGAGLHVGHPEGYTATDIVSRYKRMCGFNVLHPMGWDAFGLPAENYAIKTGRHPDLVTNENIQVFKKQIQALGFSYDWDREINTSAPDYYRWTQWFFLFLYKNSLAYKKKAPVNWCGSCQTVLANEQVVDGDCERCHNPVIQKELEQWFFKITDFIEDTITDGRTTEGLLSGLKKIDWPHGTMAAQENWIGRSEGAVVKFAIKDEKESIEVFTTRVDTIFGCTYVVVAPEHSLLKNQESKIRNQKEVKKYLESVAKKTALERTDLSKEKTGVRLDGLEAVNPFTNEVIPIFVADYVLGQYGTGAVMAVPAHDERDFAFAKKFELEIRKVVLSSTEHLELSDPKINPKRTVEIMNVLHEGKPFIEDGFIGKIGGYSGEDLMEKIYGKSSREARLIIIAHLENNNLGEGKTTYRLRDWLVSRQRYWGAPIPIIYCETCGEVPVPEKDLPVVLPDDVDFMPTGESPLHRSKKFHEVSCPSCKSPARREADTMDTFVCSSWYMFRFADPTNDQVFADKQALRDWCPVDLYVGGAEHTVLHLLYSRFFTKALHRHGYIDFDEPFIKLRHQGLILGEDGEKMSKSRGNVVNPDDVVKKYGADTLRLYEMFMGPFEAMKPWSTKSIEGSFRFAQKVYRLVEEKELTEDQPSEELNKLLHKTIKKITEDIEKFAFNTAISQMMILANEMQKEKKISLPLMKSFILILSPFAPHLAEELWEKLGHKTSLTFEPWPAYNEALTIDATFELIFSVNGRLRGKKEVSKDISEKEAIALTYADENIQRNLEGKEVVKEIYIPGKLVNIVVK